MTMGMVYGLALSAITRANREAEAQAASGVVNEPARLTGDELRPAEPVVPVRLSLVSSNKNFRPDYMRVGVRFDGVERNDVQSYDAEAGWIETVKRQVLYGVVEPFWRYPETRQQRRARERWENKR